MKKALIMVMVFVFPRLLVAQDFDVQSLAGESWYGLYLNGQKAGYAFNAIEIEDNGDVVLTEDAQFKMSMAAMPQDMHIRSVRVYGEDGALKSIDSKVTDPTATNTFHAVVEGDKLLLHKNVGGKESTSEFPAPRESLKDAVKHAQWVAGNPQVGDALSFTVFEPLYAQEVDGMSHITAVEERFLDGVPTRVYVIKTSMDLLGLDSMSHVTAEGVTLEDQVAGIMTMRLEPEAVAKDVDYSNDVIVSNAAMVSASIEAPRTRDTLRLKLWGPLKSHHLFNDERQFIESAGEHFNFVSHKIDLDGFESARIPITDEEIVKWTEPTVFIQSDEPALVAKAREIVGDTEDTFEITRKLCRWVHDNMKSTFSARLTNALEVLNSLEGDCTEHSVLFIGLARAVGLPAREVAGLIYIDDPPGFYFHQWAKVWVGKWIDVDPTFNQPLADVTHIKLAEGDLFKQAKLIPIIGRLKIEVVGNMVERPDSPAEGAGETVLNEADAS